MTAGTFGKRSPASSIRRCTPGGVAGTPRETCSLSRDARAPSARLASWSRSVSSSAGTSPTARPADCSLSFAPFLPDPIIQIQIEMRFREDLARDLARMTSGDQICLQMDPVQHELDLTVEA